MSEQMRETADVNRFDTAGEKFGYSVDDRGIVLDKEGTPVGHIEKSWDPKKPFIPRTREEIEWVMSKVADMDADRKALDVREEIFLQNMEAQRKEIQQSRDHMMAMFGADIEKFARETLEAGKWKSKTLKLDNGSVSFRQNPPSLKMNEEVALAFAKEYAPEIVIVTEKVNKTDVALAVAKLGIADDEVFFNEKVFLEKIPGSETVKISTGI